MNIAKYEFSDKAQFQTKLDALYTENEEGEKIPNQKFAVVELGHIVLTQGTYDEDGNEVTAPILSDNYCVDMAWWGLDGHPYGWKSYAIDISEGQGVHSFSGVDYQSHKF